MIIVLKPHTSDESIKKIEDVIRARGAEPHVSKGEIQTIIGMVGDTTQIDPSTTWVSFRESVLWPLSSSRTSIKIILRVAMAHGDNRNICFQIQQ